MHVKKSQNFTQNRKENQKIRKSEKKKTSKKIRRKEGRREQESPFLKILFTKITHIKNKPTKTNSKSIIYTSSYYSKSVMISVI